MSERSGDPPPGGKTLTDLLEDNLTHLRSLNYPDNSLYKRKRSVVNFCQWLEKTFNVRTADRLLRKHLQAWQKHLHEHRTSKGFPLKPTSLNRVLAEVRGFLKYLASHSYILRSMPDILEYVKTPSLLPTSVLTHTQARKILSHINPDSPQEYRDRTMLELLYSSGVRAGEILGLDLAHVDLKNATAIVMGKGRKQRVVCSYRQNGFTLP